MFVHEMQRAIAAAPRERLAALSGAIWKAYAAGAIGEGDAQALAEAVEARKAVPAVTIARRRVGAVHGRRRALSAAAAGSPPVSCRRRSPRSSRWGRGPHWRSWRPRSRRRARASSRSAISRPWPAYAKRAQRDPAGRGARPGQVGGMAAVGVPKRAEHGDDHQCGMDDLAAARPAVRGEIRSHSPRLHIHKQGSFRPGGRTGSRGRTANYGPGRSEATPDPEQNILTPRNLYAANLKWEEDRGSAQTAGLEPAHVGQTISPHPTGGSAGRNRDAARCLCRERSVGVVAHAESRRDQLQGRSCSADAEARAVLKLWPTIECSEPFAWPSCSSSPADAAVRRNFVVGYAMRASGAVALRVPRRTLRPFVRDAAVQPRCWRWAKRQCHTTTKKPRGGLLFVHCSVVSFCSFLLRALMGVSSQTWAASGGPFLSALIDHSPSDHARQLCKFNVRGQRICFGLNQNASTPPRPRPARRGTSNRGAWSVRRDDG